MDLSKKKKVAFTIKDSEIIKIAILNVIIYGGIALIPLWWIRLLIMAVLSVFGAIVWKKVTDETDQIIEECGCPYILMGSVPPEDCDEYIIPEKT